MAKAEGMREVRERLGMPIAVLARRAGMSRVTVYSVEAGDDVTLDTLIRIAQVLGVSLADISPDAAALVAEVA